MSALDRPQRQAADQEALQEQGEEDVGDDRHDPHRGDLAPQDLVPAHEARHDDRQRAHIPAVEQQREHNLVPREDEREQRGDDQAWRNERQGDAPERPEDSRAIDHRGLLQLHRQVLKKPFEQPDDKRQVEDRVCQDQGPVGIQEVQHLEHQEQRQRRRYRREHARGQNREREVLAPRAEPREGVGGRDAHHHGGHHRADRDDQAVPNTLYPTAAVGREAHGIHVVGEGERLRDEYRRISEKLLVALKRGQEHPRDRKQEDGEGRDEDHQGQQPATGRASPHVAIPALTRFWYRRKTWATTVMTTSWMNASADV